MCSSSVSGISSRIPHPLNHRSSQPLLFSNHLILLLFFDSRSRLDKGLASLVRERKTDLVIIEGMGRAIHTNYHAKLKCESLKLAVLKNSWLADRLGGKIFSVIFKYEVPLKSS